MCMLTSLCTFLDTLAKGYYLLKYELETILECLEIVSFLKGNRAQVDGDHDNDHDDVDDRAKVAASCLHTQRGELNAFA